VTERSAGFGISAIVLQVDPELAQLDDRRAAPADRVGRKRQRERLPFALRSGLPARNAVVPGRRLDREADGLKASDELATAFLILGPGSPARRSACQHPVRCRSDRHTYLRRGGSGNRVPDGRDGPWGDGWSGRRLVAP
jgi:hypothetical protein